MISHYIFASTSSFHCYPQCKIISCTKRNENFMATFSMGLDLDNGEMALRSNNLMGTVGRRCQVVIPMWFLV